MAEATFALNQHFLFGLSNLRTTTWLPGRKTLFPSQKKPHLSLCSSSTSPPPPSSSTELDTPTAESCVNLGLSLFSKGRVKDALAQFETALTLDPNPVEAQAALYNKACCHAYRWPFSAFLPIVFFITFAVKSGPLKYLYTRGEGKKAAECLRTALREYNLKFGTILNDPDLASFRALPEFKELQEEARLGGEDIGYSFRRDLKLISEVQAPFRGVRSNPAGIIIFVALFFWDNKKEEEQLAQISRNETLSRLPLRLSTKRVVELVQLRDTVRPVILAGKKETVSLAIQKAERFRTELLRRGVLLVPVIWGQAKAPQITKKGFGNRSKAAPSLPSIGEDFDKRALSITAKSKLKTEVRFKAEVVSPAEWERWIEDQQKSEGVTPGEDVYIILRLDGRVRRSGKGMPDWQQIVKELPPMEALLSKLER
ncbi:hypothetical protein RHMOL_Rhmol01G0376400 [Rhododendron molle]|uniref:Uncharacterized protein n=1 Tax=Rhododendron molle TaxID=49168 RepID=A0ACC0QCM4_RHOML|nr:hypothetical protein RHMOL_Rhmol01G0376400 [Rhododendron molle]